ncbi:unnamed protein product [Closterium sp. Naga37s-1]|nr:unnamed protein product [Closterium sp. Naga37s-1]
MEKMLSGEPYNSWDPPLVELRQLATQRTSALNATPAGEVEKRRKMSYELLGEAGENLFITSPFLCDYGCHITVGRNVYMNFGCVLLDCNRITIGDDVLFGPYVQLYTAAHPTHPTTRLTGVETAHAITIGSNKTIREEKKTPLPIPPLYADAHRILLFAAVCRRWRGLTQRCVSALLVRENLVVSRQALASAVAALPNLTHLHLCDGSVETLDDAFLAHLASSCPNLAILHVGSRIAPVKCKDHYAGKCEKDALPITTAGLDFFFRHCTRLEQLSLYCLDRCAKFPASFFQLPHLHTLALTNASPLETPKFAKLTSLTSLHLASRYLLKRVENIVRLSRITTFSSSDEAVAFHRDSLVSADVDMAQLPLLKPSSLVFAYFDTTQLALLKSYHVADLPDVSVLPWLRKLCLKLVGGEERMAVGSSLARVKQLELALQEEAVELPFSLALLPQLHTLVMWNAGKMLRLPSDMGWAVPQLRVLQIHCARELRELPDSIGAASRLRQLHLFDCPALHHLPASLTQLACLHQLHVENTGLRCLPSGFAQLTRLRSLSVRGCLQLAGLPEDLTELKMLRLLNIGSCKNVCPGWNEVLEPRGLEDMYGLKIDLY